MARPLVGKNQPICTALRLLWLLRPPPGMIVVSSHEDIVFYTCSYAECILLLVGFVSIGCTRIEFDSLVLGILSNALFFLCFCWLMFRFDDARRILAPYPKFVMTNFLWFAVTGWFFSGYIINYACRHI